MSSTPNEESSNAEARLEQLEHELRELATERRRTSRRRRWALASLLVALVAVPLGTRALGPLPHVFSAGDPIVASEINENFDHLAGAISELDEPLSLCGRTAETDGSISAPGGLTGYPAAAALCRATCGTATAHMCTDDDVLLLLQSGVRERGWFTGSDGDCRFWTSAGSDVGALMLMPDGAEEVFEGHLCTDFAPILCCD